MQPKGIHTGRSPEDLIRQRRKKEISFLPLNAFASGCSYTILFFFLFLAVEDKPLVSPTEVFLSKLLAKILSLFLALRISLFLPALLVLTLAALRPLGVLTPALPKSLAMEGVFLASAPSQS